MSKPNIFINCKITSKIKRRVMKKWIRQFVKYYRKPSNEFGFMVLSFIKKWTYLPVNIFIDDGGLWTNIGNKKIILFQTNKCEDRDFNKIIPMSIEDDPKILIKDGKINLSIDELEQIKDFVKKCKDEIILLGNNSINHLSFFEKIENKGFFYSSKNT